MTQEFTFQIVALLPSRTMKTFIPVLALVVIAISSLFFRSPKSTDGEKATSTSIPSVKLKTIKGEPISSSTFGNDGKPFVINFWATWCKPCVLELNAIHQIFEEWTKETGVKIYAISLDDARNSSRVAPFVKSRGWAFEVLIDENGDFRRAIGVNNPPQTFLYNGKSELMWQHTGYAPGDEETLLSEIKKLSIATTEKN